MEKKKTGADRNREAVGLKNIWSPRYNIELKLFKALLYRETLCHFTAIAKNFSNT